MDLANSRKLAGMLFRFLGWIIRFYNNRARSLFTNICTQPSFFCWPAAVSHCENGMEKKTSGSETNWFAFLLLPITICGGQDTIFFTSHYADVFPAPCSDLLLCLVKKNSSAGARTTSLAELGWKQEQNPHPSFWRGLPAHSAEGT